jgi:hypothetical protein
LKQEASFAGAGIDYKTGKPQRCWIEKAVPPILAGYKMLTSTLKTLSLTEPDAVFRGELKGIIQPHG